VSIDSMRSLVRIPGGRYRIESDRYYPEEAPNREIEASSF